MTGPEKYPMVSEEPKAQKITMTTYNDIKDNLSDLLKLTEEIRNKADITKFIVEFGYYQEEKVGDKASNSVISERGSMVDEMESTINSIRAAVSVISLKLNDIQNIIGL